MRSEPATPGIGLTTVIRACAIVASIVIGFICLRMPIHIFGKIALVVFAILIIRWLSSVPRKIESDLLFQQGLKFERYGDGESAIRNYERALVRSPDNTSIALRLLAVYNAALQVNNAKDLIQRLNCRVFQENEIGELEAIISHYRCVHFEKNARECVVQLTD